MTSAGAFGAQSQNISRRRSSLFLSPPRSDYKSEHLCPEGPELTATHQHHRRERASQHASQVNNLDSCQWPVIGGNSGGKGARGGAESNEACWGAPCEPCEC